MKRFRRALCALLSALFFMFPVCAAVTDAVGKVEIVEPAVAAAMGDGCFSVLLMEAQTGRVLFENNADAPHPVASVTKVMTLLLVMEALARGEIALTDAVSVSENAAGMGGSQIYLEVGEQMTVDELLKAVVVSSANDGAVALAEHVAGSEAVFVERMNARAAELSMQGSFINTTGLDDNECHELSARDVAIMSRELLRHEKIIDYTTIWMDTVRGGQFGLSNTNKLVRFYEGATGLKTGSTAKAKYCVSASARRGGMQLIAVIIGADSSDRRFAAAKELLNFGFAGYALYAPQTADIAPVKVWGGEEDSVLPLAEVEGVLVKKGDLSKVQESVSMETELFAPVEQGQTIGYIRYTVDGEIIAEHPIRVQSPVKRAGVGFFFRRLLQQLLLG